MIILSKLADYGVIIATYLAGRETRDLAVGPVNAVTIAAETRLPQATVAKVLKLLSRGGVVAAARGAAGGYRLTRLASAITVAEVVAAIDGALAMTQCTSGAEPCDRLHFCPTRPHWHRINEAVERALDGITLAEMVAPAAPPSFLPAKPSIAELSLP
jgi:FeS assembly SUF system regulator